MPKSLYFNIEDDVKSVIERLRREPGADFTLVFPRRSYVFADPVNLKLLKKQLDMLRKQAAILTMDERGRQASEEAGFVLQTLPGRGYRVGTADISKRPIHFPEPVAATPEASRVVEPVAPALKKQIATSGAVPKVAVHDTIFSDVPKRQTFESGDLRVIGQHPHRRRTIALGAIALLVAVISLVLVYALPSAQILVHAKTESITRDLEIAMGTTTKHADVNTLSMPVTFFDQSVDLEKKFDASGKKEVGSKARGKVRVFNLTGASINLKASTTTLFSGDKKYVFVTDQNYIRAVSEKNVTKPNSGHLAEVVAVAGGEGLNIPAGTRLEVTNQVFGNKPELLYAVVDEGIVGGSSRFISVIEQTDIASAQEELTRAIVGQLTDSLKMQNKFLAERAYETVVTAFTTDKPAGFEANSFNAKLTLQVKGLSFDPAMLTVLVRDRVNQVLPAGGHLQASAKDSLTFKVRQVDVAAGMMRLIVHLESRMLRDVSTAELSSKLAGLTQEQAQKFLTQNGNIDRAEILVRPSWQHNLPRLAGRIEVVERED